MITEQTHSLRSKEEVLGLIPAGRDSEIIVLEALTLKVIYGIRYQEYCSHIGIANVTLTRYFQKHRELVDYQMKILKSLGKEDKP